MTSIFDILPKSLIVCNIKTFLDQGPLCQRCDAKIQDAERESLEDTRPVLCAVCSSFFQEKSICTGPRLQKQPTQRGMGTFLPKRRSITRICAF